MRNATLLVLLLIFSGAQTVLSQQAAVADTSENGKPAAPAAAEKKAADKPAPPETETVKQMPFHVDVSLKGNFVSVETNDVVLRPQTWSTFKVDRAVPHGTWVREGETLVWLDKEKLEEAIKSAKTALELSKHDYVIAAADLKMQEKSLALDKQSIELARQNANDELQHFQKVGRELAEEMARNRLKSSEFTLEYYQEELNQLEKMYKADDLTEETEEIILKRARKQVEFAQFNLQLARDTVQQSLEKRIPQQAKLLEENAERYNLLHAKSQVTLPIGVEKAKLALDKMKLQIQLASEKLDKLQADLELMDIKAPAEGVVYYGQWDQGQWSGKSTADAKLRKGGTLTANQVFMTIVAPRNLEVSATVEEKDLHLVSAGIGGKVVPTAFPDTKLQAVVATVSPVPVAKEKFQCRLKLKPLTAIQKIMPGMTCEVKLTAYQNPRAIVLPETAVFSEDKDDDQKYVYLALDGGKHKKQPVQTGHKSDKKIEIVSGLTVGDKYLLSKPKNEK